jgi:sugar phosphate permease
LERKGVGFLDAWKIPGVFYCCTAYGFIKLIDYGVLFWLAQYLDDEANQKDQAANIISVGNIGYTLGMLILGWVSDKTDTRAFFVPFILTFSTALYFVTQILNSTDVVFWYVSIIMAMTLIAGP